MRNDNPVGSINERDVIDMHGARTDAYISPENPYYQQLQSARGEYRDLVFELAVKWEENRQTILEQREYEDPAAQIARERAAGINSDLPGTGSGGSVSSGSTAVQPAATSNYRMSNETEKANSYSNIANTSLQSLTAVLSSALNLSIGFQTYGDTIARSKNSRDLSNLQVLLASQGLDNSAVDYDIKQQELSNLGVQGDILSAELLSRGFSNSMGVLDSADKFLQLMPSDATDDEVAEMWSLLGMPDSEKFLPIVNNLRKNSRFRAFHNAWKLQDKKTQAENDAVTSDTLRELYSNSYAEQLYRSRNGRTVALFESMVNSIFATSENASTVASNMATDLDTQTYVSNLQNEQVRYDFSAFGVRMEQASEFLNKAYDSRDAIQSDYDKHPTKTNKARLDAVNVYISNLEGSTCETLENLYNLVDGWNSVEYISSTLVDAGEPATAASDFRGRYIDMNNFLFNRLYDPANGRLNMSAAITAAIAGAMMYLSKGKGTPKQVPGKPYTYTVTQ